MANIKELDAIIAHIEQHPETWNQDSWVSRRDCGTAYCVAGWAVARKYGEVQIKEKLYINDSFRVGTEVHTFERAGRDILELTFVQATWLFAPGNTLEDIKLMRDALAADPDADLEEVMDY
jgi:hypothetical protein